MPADRRTRPPTSWLGSFSFAFPVHLRSASIRSTSIALVIRRHLDLRSGCCSRFRWPASRSSNGCDADAFGGAQSCPDVEVVFARGRLESPGVGILGNAFINALRSKSNKNIGVYAVRYPADNEIDVGANDMSATFSP